MPSSNPVYQPTTTTVTYERHKEWSANYLTDTVIPNCHQKPCLQRLLLFGAIILAIVGLGLAVYALIADANAHKEDAADVDLSLDDNSDENEENAESESFDQNDNHDHETNVVLGSVGICLVLLSLGMYICFLQIRGVCKGFHMVTNPIARSAHCSQNLGESTNHAESGISSVTYKGVQVDTCHHKFLFSEIQVFYLLQQDSSPLNLEPAAPTEEERHSLMDSKYQR